MRHFTGNPSGSAPKSFSHGAEQWALGFRTDDGKGDYINLKLYSLGRVDAKANYWFGYSRKQKRFCRKSDTKLLQAHRPLLYNAVLAYLQGYYV